MIIIVISQHMRCLGFGFCVSLVGGSADFQSVEAVTGFIDKCGNEMVRVTLFSPDITGGVYVTDGCQPRDLGTLMATWNLQKSTVAQSYREKYELAQVIAGSRTGYVRYARRLVVDYGNQDGSVLADNALAFLREVTLPDIRFARKKLVVEGLDEWLGWWESDPLGFLRHGNKPGPESVAALHQCTQRNVGGFRHAATYENQESLNAAIDACLPHVIDIARLIIANDRIASQAGLEEVKRLSVACGFAQELRNLRLDFQRSPLKTSQAVSELTANMMKREMAPEIVGAEVARWIANPLQPFPSEQ